MPTGMLGLPPKPAPFTVACDRRLPGYGFSMLVYGEETAGRVSTGVVTYTG